MVGHRFCETLIEQGIAAEKRVIVFGGEPRPAYDRIHLSSWFGEEPVDLTLQSESWYRDNWIELRLGDPVTAIDRSARTVTTASGHRESYDRLVLATGSSALMPPLPGMDRAGVFAYRTIEDLEAITAYSRTASQVAVIGGGLLGLEAARPVSTGLSTTVIEIAPRLMPASSTTRGGGPFSAIRGLGIEVLASVPPPVSTEPGSYRHQFPRPADPAG
jgi:nitrite reductase (NADH) large subunit